MAGRLDDGDDLIESHEINVTPFIDVMLVLLIIFMVAAPLATADINVDLPSSTATPTERPQQPVWLTVSDDLSMAVGDQPIADDDLAAALHSATGGDMETRIYLRADESLSYGQIMQVMNQMRDSGWTSIALVGLEAAAPANTGSAP